MAHGQAELTHHYATAPDGGQLSYYSVGSGPGVLVLHGAVSYALLHEELAHALSPFFTVHVASRRGRGLSGPYPPAVTDLPIHPDDTAGAAAPAAAGAPENGGLTTIEVGGQPRPRTYAPAFASAVLATDLSDLQALLAATGAEFLLGISSGALVVLETLLRPSSRLARLRRAVVFEPPILFADRPTSLDMALLPRFERELAAGDSVGAGVTAMHLVELGPTWIPRFVMTTLSGFLFRSQDRAAAKRRAQGDPDRGVSTMGGLIPALRYDFAVTEAMVGLSSRYAPLAREGGAVDLLLLSGAKTPTFLREGMGVLEEVLPGAKSVVVDGVGHELPCNAEMRGQPAKAVPALRDFFGDDGAEVAVDDRA